AGVLDHRAHDLAFAHLAAVDGKGDVHAGSEVNGHLGHLMARDERLGGCPGRGCRAGAGGVAGAQTATAGRRWQAVRGIVFDHVWPGCEPANSSSAFIAAAATGDPPRLPSTVMKGVARFISSCFDSAAATKPTGTPMISAGWQMPASTMSSSASSAVGALPMTAKPPSRSLASWRMPA